jgi:pSer/pThr/pTyr-binding forkhead associated (FHA) protein
VSRRHARLERRAERWLLSDLGSSNGTYVGTRRLATGEQHELRDGDALRFGPTARSGGHDAGLSRRDGHVVRLRARLVPLAPVLWPR